jgi:hypothetical protein
MDQNITLPFPLEQQEQAEWDAFTKQKADELDEEIVQDLLKLVNEGKVSACACMGPLRGDPYCFCEMNRRGLTPTPSSPEEDAQLKAALAKMFGWEEVKRG